MNKRLNPLFLLISLFFAITAVLNSCISEPLFQNENGTSYLYIKKYSALTRAYPETAELDNKITKIRILAFDPTLGTCRSNKLYDASLLDVIKHEIEPGIYDFVFLANEPDAVTSDLGSVTRYSDLNSISYSETIINSVDLIPMGQEIKSVEVLANSAGAKVLSNNPKYAGETHKPLELSLSRYATRVDITLESEEDFTNSFKGITLSGIPAGVPLLSSDNGSFNRNITRAFDKNNNSELFDFTVTEEQKGRGVKWACKITRTILPYNDFSPTNDKTKATVLTVNMENRQSPSCELKIVTGSSDENSNFTLPRDAALLVLGKIKIPSVELNVQVMPWQWVDASWQIPQSGWLTVSQIEANITDFNGVRIKFSSNMPVVKVLPTVFVGGTGYETAETNRIFNDLAIEKSGATSTSRFSYKYDEATKTGSGYMDVILDEYTINDDANKKVMAMPLEQTFRLILSAEDAATNGIIQREIKINTEQHGQRVKGFAQYGTGYAGAFFRYNETGERVIIGQLVRNKNKVDFQWTGPYGDKTVTLQEGDMGRWTANIEVGADYFTLSTTPSFDPNIGTDTPGNPELYPVKTNEYKSAEYGGYGEYGTYIEGRGRIYFRIGAKGTLNSATDKPVYGVVRIRYTESTTKEDEINYGATPATWVAEHRLYIRQGEAADYVMENESITDGDLKGKSRTGTVKFSPYNLTAAAYLADPNIQKWSTWEQPRLEVKGGTFVKYPSQGGAYFQWYLHNDVASENMWYWGRWRMAYNPVFPSSFGTSDWPGHLAFMTETPIWGAQPTSVPSGDPSPALVNYVYNIKDNFEICPPGWRYPTDGLTDRLVFNGPYPNTFSEELGKYIHRDPRATNKQLLPDWNAGVKPTYDYSSQIINSEIRKSLFHAPIGGTTTTTGKFWDGADGATANVTGALMIFNTLGRSSGQYFNNINTFLNTWSPDNSFATVKDNNISSQIGFYADGFYDRRPAKQIRNDDQFTFGVSTDNAEVAYGGMVIYNKFTKASLFFPMAGRRFSNDGSLMETGNRGYYWTSTAGPMGIGMPISAWYMSIGWYPAPGPGYTLPSFAQSVRCVKE